MGADSWENPSCFKSKLEKINKAGGEHIIIMLRQPQISFKKIYDIASDEWDNSKRDAHFNWKLTYVPSISN